MYIMQNRGVWDVWPTYKPIVVHSLSMSDATW